jgi:Arc/MetJ family transcription regulator
MYTSVMTKKLIDVDDELLSQAKEVLGVSTFRDAVNGALGDVVRRHHRREYARLLAAGEHDLSDPEAMSGAWR